jgi:hypothetical protein
MFRYAEEECDVFDKCLLQQYREKRLQWIEWLRGNDKHSIWNQVSEITWRNAFFRTINDLRHHAIESPKEMVGFNGYVLSLFDSGFVTEQAAAIRRVTDKNSNRHGRGVVSLRRLLDDFIANRGLITREIFVCHDGLPYAYSQDEERRYIQSLPKSMNGATRCFSLPVEGPHAWSISELVHESFDLVSGVCPTERSRGDLIELDIFDGLVNHLDICRDVRVYASKFVAHAADSISSANLADSQRGVTLVQLEKCTKAIFQVMNFVSTQILWDSSLCPLSIPEHDHLENLDKCWIPTGQEVIARDFWNTHSRKIDNWAEENFWPSGKLVDA